jgi:catechol 2,3-dioxygenase-like lactoylglutathione lyase family enzyme
MRATGLNHVSIQASDFEASRRFYVDVFGMEELPTPNFGFPVLWLRVGDLQIHLFETGANATGTQHLAIEVDDYEEAYRQLKARGVFGGGSSGFFGSMYEMPDGGVQMYFRDPAGNLIEIDHPKLAELDRSLFGDDLKVLADLFPQSEENKRSTLWLRLREEASVGS